MTPDGTESGAEAAPKPPAEVEFLGYDHIHFWVGNAAQSAAYYASRFGFRPLARRSLETGSREMASYAVAQNDVIFVFSSALTAEQRDIAEHVRRHGDGVKDLALAVRDCRAAYDFVVANGARSIAPPHSQRDAHGEATVATVAAGFGDTWHSLVQRDGYRGAFLPGFEALGADGDPLVLVTASPQLRAVDHVVSNNADGDMEAVVRFYTHTFGFHRYWSVDDRQIHTQYSSLRSVVVADASDRVLMPVNEPAQGRRKSQIQEFVDYYDGAGVQHIALRTDDIVNAIRQLRARGVSFTQVPPTYYEDLRARLASATVRLAEELDTLQSLGILVDFDERGYLLQIFTRPLTTRPTLFLEVIQRANNSGFGVGNFKGLFEAIEREQEQRGNL